MAGRPTKQGIDYFPLDVDFFRNVKIRKVMKACGSQSASILICLLCSIYQDRGYYIEWTDDMPFGVADTVGVSEGAVRETIVKALQVGFFDQALYEKHHILTSEGIQKRFLLATYQRKKTEINPDFLINCANNSISCTKNSINCASNEQSKSISYNNNQVESIEESKALKEKSPKGEPKKKAKTPSAAACAATLEERMKKFRDDLKPYEEEYGLGMIENFFGYWSEHNENGRKMRKEKEKVFDIKRRLNTWRSKEVQYGNRANRSYNWRDECRRQAEETKRRIYMEGATAYGITIEGDQGDF